MGKQARVLRLHYNHIFCFSHRSEEIEASGGTHRARNEHHLNTHFINFKINLFSVLAAFRPQLICIFKHNASLHTCMAYREMLDTTGRMLGIDGVRSVYSRRYLKSPPSFRNFQT